MNTGKMTVAHYAPVWLPLTQTWMFNQLHYLPATIDNHVICRSARNLEQFGIPHLHCLKQEGFARYLAYKARFVFGGREGFPYFDEQIRKIRPDVVHSHFGNNGWTVHKAVSRVGIPHVVTFYGQDLSRLPKTQPVWVERYRELFAQPATRFLCEGSAMARSLEQLGCPREKIISHHLGVEVDKIRFEPRRWSANEPLKVLIAASFREKKGIPYALEALARIRAKIPLQITIIGDSDQTAAGREEKEKILATIQRHDLGGVTQLLGYQPHARFWSEAYGHHLFLSPSVTASDGDSEGGAPVSLIDVSASGMPVVSSFHCDIPEVIRHGETGWLAQERDVQSIVDAIHQWLNASPAQWQQMLLASRQHIEQEYDAALQGKRLAAIYSALR